METRWFNIYVQTPSGKWVLRSVQETAAAAEKARVFYIEQGYKPSEVKVEQD